jgi:hypothetical protein
MAKAANHTITTNATTLPQLTPTACEYLDHNKVRVSLKNDAGEAVTFMLTTAMLISLLNMGVKVINTSTAQIFRDIGA